MWEAVSAGGSFWNVGFNGQHPGATYDRRNALLTADVFAYMERHEDVLTVQEAEAEVTVLYSRATNGTLGSGDRQKDGYMTHLIGLEQVLTDRRVQYRLLTDDKLNSETLAAAKVLILANAACLSEQEMEIIRAYVKAGGKLLSTYRTSLVQENGTERPDYALGDVFGCSFTGVVKDNSTFGYQLVKERNGLTKGFEDTELLASWGPQYLVRLTSAAAAESLLTYVPQIFPQPPERSWLRSYETDYPTLVLNRYGEGESVFFPYGVDRNVWLHGHADFAELISNAVDYLLDGNYKVKTNAPSSVHFSLNRSGGEAGAYVLHAVNTTSLPRRPILETVPVAGIEVAVTLRGCQVTEFRILHADSAIEMASSEPGAESGTVVVHIRIPEIREYTGIYMKLV